MNINNKNLFLIILPVMIFILAVIFSTDIVFTHKVDLNFIYTDGKIGGSRWFSYKYSSDKYFHENDTLSSNQFIRINDAIEQVPEISKTRGYSNGNISLLYHIIDSFAQISNQSINNQKVIDIMKLNIALDEINQ